MRSDAHYKNLDGLRGVAALVVVLYHYVTLFFPFLIGFAVTTHHTQFDRLIATTPIQFPFAGNFAVCIFFVLSGFVLSVGFFKHDRDSNTLISGAVRRYFRLMIPALVSVLLGYLLVRQGLFYNHQVAHISPSTPEVSALWHFHAHLIGAFLQGLYGIWFGTYIPHLSYNNVLWTMHYELFGSFLVFMFLAFFGKLKNRWLIYGLFAVAFMKTYYLAFVAGMLICDVMLVRPAAYKYRFRTGVLWLLAAVGIFLGTWGKNVYPHLYTNKNMWWFTAPEIEKIAHIVGAAAIVIVVLKSSMLTSLLERRPFQYLGRISFALYLTHYLLIGTLGSYVFVRFYPYYGFKAFILAAGVVTPLMFVVAHFYTKLIDIPAITLSKRIGGYLLNGDVSGDLRRLAGRLGDWQPAPHTKPRRTPKPVAAVPQRVPEAE